MQTEIVFSIAGVLLAVITFYIGRQTSAKADGKQDGIILSELGYLKSSMDGIKTQLAKQEDRDRDYISRLVAVEASCKSMHLRIDQLCSRKE